MAQKVLFPGTHMRITQDEYGVTSHKGSLARDDGGESTAFDSPVLAPFDGYFTRVRTDSSHETYFVSDEPVECANGYVGSITFLFMHDNLNRFAAGAHVKQGTIIGYEGGFGNGRKDRFAHHTHREWSQGKNTTQYKNSRGTYVIANQMHEYDVCFLRPDTMVYTRSGFVRADNLTIVKDNVGHAFKIDKEAENDMKFLKVLSDKCEVFSRADVNAVDTTYNGGRLKVGEHYPIQADVGSDGTYAWVRIQAGAEKRYAVVLPDRSEIVELSAGDAITACMAQADSGGTAELEAELAQATAERDAAISLASKETTRADAANKKISDIKTYVASV